MLSGVVEGSLVLRSVRRVAAGSLVCRAMLVVMRSFSGRDSWFGSRIVRMPSSRTWTRAARVASGSVLLGTVDRMLRALPLAWAASGIRAEVLRATGSVALAPRIALLGIAFMAAVATHVVLDWAQWSASPWGMALSGLGVACSVLAIVGSRPVADAWRDRS